MKRLLHALAVLWPLPPRTGPSPCQSADLPIRELAKSQPSASAQKANGVKRRPDERSDIGISESILNNKTIFHLDRRYCNVLAFMTLFMCLIAAYKAPAQTGAAVNMDEIQPLQIGDTIPEELWHLPLQVVNHPEGKETITLNDYRGKLIILDFWAPWCAPCVHGLNKLDSIQRLPELDHSQYAVIPITYQQMNEIIDPIQRLGWSFPSICGDTILSQSFPHAGLPHQVWIRNDKILAIPPPQFATAEIIAQISTGEIDSLPSERIPFPFPSISPNTDDFWVLKEGNPDYFSQAPLTLPQETGTLFLIGNARLLRDLFGFAYEPIVSKYHTRFEPPGTPGSFIELETSDSLSQWLKAEYEQHPISSDSPAEAHNAFRKWICERTHTYIRFQSASSSNHEDELSLLREDLNSYFSRKMGIRARVEERPKMMAFLRFTRPIDSIGRGLVADDVDMLHHEVLKSYIRRALPKGIPLVDNIALEQENLRWALTLPPEPTLDILIEILEPNGIVIETRPELVPLLVISEDKNH